MSDDLVFKIIIWAFFWPFILAWKLLKPFIIYRQTKDAEKEQEIILQQQASKVETRNVARSTQLQRLKVTTPSAPPERMRATIQINEHKRPRIEHKRIPRLIGEDDYIYLETGEDTRFAVDMILEMTEAERAVIKQHRLDDIILEETAAYTEMDIIEAKHRMHEEFENTKDINRKYMTKEINKQTIENMQKERTQTRLGDLLVSPFSRSFDSPHKAKEYADKLKTKFLPQIRKLLDQYTQHKPSETLEF